MQDYASRRPTGKTLGQAGCVKGNEEDDGGQLLSRKEGLEHGLLMLPPDRTTHLALAVFTSMLAAGGSCRQGR